MSIIVAAAENGVIGREGGLPWRMPSDLKAFRRLTMGCPVVMGRKTFQSIGKPLEGRDNIVVTRDGAFAHEGVLVAAGVHEALQIARLCALKTGAGEVFVIGGAEIYTAALPLAERIYLTRIHARPEGDAQFADPDPDQWQEVRREAIETGSGDQHAATLIVLERKRRDNRAEARPA